MSTTARFFFWSCQAVVEEMKAIRAILVDDETPARDRLRLLLRKFDNVEVIGEAGDGERAVELIEEESPDLVFLDIQMPGCDGLEVAASLPRPRPQIIFCTAYDQYAVDAFELNAIDYLLKPVNRARLARAIQRVENSGRDSAEGRIDQVTRSDAGRPQRFLAKRGARFHVISRQEVLCFESEHGLTQLVTQHKQYWMQPTLTDLEDRLDPTEFFRISRSAIVRLPAVREVVPLMGGHGQVLLTSGKKLDVSRRRFKALLEHLAGD
jgi:two-component system LytT family response regulator